MISVQKFRPSGSNDGRSGLAGRLLVAVLHGTTTLVEFGLAWAERARQRHALQRMSAEALKDIGLTPGDAYREGSKPFWAD